MHVAFEERDHRLAGVMQRADVDRYIAIALSHAVAVSVMERVGEVAVIDDEGIAGPEDLLGHLIHGRYEGIFQNLESDGIERRGLGHSQAS